MRKRLGLVGNYAVKSLALTCLMAVILSMLVSQRVDDAIIDANGRSAVLAVNSMLAHELEGSSLDQPLSGDTFDGFDAHVRSDLLVSGIGTIKLWNTAGMLVYSSDDVGVGRTYADNDEVGEAASGEIVSEIIRKPSSENRPQFERLGPLMEVYAPLYATGDDTPIGVFEVYQSYSPVQAQINEARLIIWAVVLLGAFILFFTQLQIVRRAARRLHAAEDEMRLMNTRLGDSLKNLEEYSVGTLEALLAAVDAKDSYTARHSLSVTDYALAIGRRLKLTSDELADLERAGLLHDIGKIGVSESVLLKPSKLTPEEREAIEEHCLMGARILESIPFLRELMPVVLHHHERWDGGGYPSGLMKEQIPVLARVLAVADAFDAMMSDRPYRVAMHLKDARSELLRCRGQQFEPRCIDALMEALDGGELWGVGPHTAGSGSGRVSAAAG